MNGQIVLCKGINDGAELESSIEKLSRYLPYLQSVSVVPVGLTEHRGRDCTRWSLLPGRTRKKCWI